MNAYELADYLEEHMHDGGTDLVDNEAAKMLRQQADRITELEFNIRMNEMKYLERIEELEAKLQIHDVMDSRCKELMKQVKGLIK